jgi:hypothetical protein
VSLACVRIPPFIHCAAVAVIVQASGYVASFDLRDPGVYTIEVVIGWFFGDTEVRRQPPPVLVGSHVGHEPGTCQVLRARVTGGAIGVELRPDAVTDALPRFGQAKCTGADHKGRWIDMSSRKECELPYCTSSVPGVFQDCDAVRTHFTV